MQCPLTCQLRMAGVEHLTVKQYTINSFRNVRTRKEKNRILHIIYKSHALFLLKRKLTKQGTKHWYFFFFFYLMELVISFNINETKKKKRRMFLESNYFPYPIITYRCLHSFLATAIGRDVFTTSHQLALIKEPIFVLTLCCQLF